MRSSTKKGDIFTQAGSAMSSPSRSKVHWVGLWHPDWEFPSTIQEGPLHIIFSLDYLHSATPDIRPALLIRPAEDAIWLGPLLLETRPSCLDCLRFWLGLHWWREYGRDKPTVAWEAVSRLLTSAVQHYSQYGDVPDLAGAMLRIELATGRAQTIEIAARADCHHCGPKASPPSMNALLNPITGIVENVRVAPNAFAGLSFANAVVACPIAKDGIGRWLAPLSASGKGASPEIARGMLLMEAIERHSSVFCGTERLVGAESVEARSALTGGTVHVSAADAYLGYASPSHALESADTNGCAAGQTMAEAIMHAALEVIERDAFAIWWRNRAPRPQLNPGNDEILSYYQRELAGSGRALRLIDLTTDLRIPVVAAYSFDRAGANIYLGAAADLDCWRAARRATEEMLQFWFWGRLQADPPDRASWLSGATLEAESWLDGTLGENWPQADETPDLLTSIARARFDVWQVDLTRPWLQTPVVRAVIPGLCHPRGPITDRLLEAPVRMGWLSERRNAADLNPYSFPI
jgi:ribosomal protein S12 methylthiotransferase accessory factor YcaO